MAKRKTKQTKHNAKSLRRYKTKELREFIKKNKLPVKRTSKMTKTEIVGVLLKLQRNGKCECIIKLPFRDTKKLSPLQRQALLKGQNTMRERRNKIKNKVTESQNLNKIPVKIPVTKEIIEEIRDELRRDEKPTILEQTKGNAPVFEDILGLDELFEKAELISSRDINFFKELFGLTEKEEEIKIKEKPLNPEAEEFIPKKEEEEENIPIEEEFMKREMKQLKVPELKKLLRDNNLRVGGRKQELIDRIFENLSTNSKLQDELAEKLAEKQIS